jgi:hypothetical protein
MSLLDFARQPRPIHGQARINEIYELRGQKVASQIAAEYGMTRNAVIGIWQRERVRRGENPMRESSRKPLTQEEREQRRIRELRQKAEYRRRRRERDAQYCGGPRLVYSRPEPPAPVFTTPANNGAGKAFLDLGPKECRWPLGELLDRPTAFCGDAVAHDKCSYCEGHRRMSMRPAPDWNSSERRLNTIASHMRALDSAAKKYDPVEGLPV